MPAVAVVAAVASAAVGVASVVHQVKQAKEAKKAANKSIAVQKQAVATQEKTSAAQVKQQEKEFQVQQEQVKAEQEAASEAAALEKQRADGGAKVKLGAKSTAGQSAIAPKGSGTPAKGTVKNNVGGVSASKKLGLK